MSSLLRRCLATLPAALLLACHGPVRALGGSAAEARAHADTLLGALALRFGPQERGPDLERIRPEIAQHALTPSRLFDNPKLWTGESGTSRTLEVSGRPDGAVYRLTVARGAALPSRPAEYRRILRLARLGQDEYEWEARDELAVGSVTADDLARAWRALLDAAERSDARSVRAAYRAELPRTTATLERLFSLDTLALTPNPTGGVDVRLAIGIHADRLAATAPHYAKYLDRYAGPSVVTMRLLDEGGREWWRAWKEEGDVVHLVLRVRDGALAPLVGPPARMPPHVRVHIDASTKAWIFRVGLRALVGEVTLVGAPHEKGFEVRFRREPEWDLPPLVERMLHTPLRRPFEGDGAMLSFAVQDDPEWQTLALREYRIAVQESQIMRWLGGLGSSAVSDFRHGAEEEFDRFNGAVLAALRTDLVALTAAADQ